MKILLIIIAVMLLTPVADVEARSSNQSKHLKENADYDCSRTSKPAAPKWVDVRKKNEKVGNKKLELVWEDADRAHDVEILYKKVGASKWKSKKTGDDGDQKFKSLQNGQRYEFKVRGISNCGKSSWTKGRDNVTHQYSFLP